MVTAYLAPDMPDSARQLLDSCQECQPDRGSTLWHMVWEADPFITVHGHNPIRCQETREEIVPVKTAQVNRSKGG